MAARLTPYDRDSSLHSYLAAQRYRSEREPVPCGYCGNRQDAGCRHWDAINA